jgi:hypothetical protein
MSAISAAEMIRLWERGVSLRPAMRAVALIQGERSGPANANLATMSIGERDGKLLALRESLFGRKLNSVTECPKCSVVVEFTLDTKELRDSSAPLQSAPLRLTLDGVDVQFRLLNNADVEAVADCKDVASARRLLAERCVTEATKEGASIAPHGLSEAVINALAEQLAEHDKQADISLDFRCPECATIWVAAFDIASYLWVEISARAKRLLSEVHVLAWAYGWTEADILAMSDARRQFYLGAVQ